MVSTGDDAPDFTAPLANGDVDSFTLTERLDDAPLVLAFFPGAYTGVCTSEMEAFQEHLTEIQDTGASLYGISVDLPFSQNEFRNKHGLEFALLSDTNRKIIDAFDISMDFDHIGVEGVAKRSVFVVNAEGTISYSWVSDDPGVEPDYEEVIQAAAEAA